MEYLSHRSRFLRCEFRLQMLVRLTPRDFIAVLLQLACVPYSRPLPQFRCNAVLMQSMSQCYPGNRASVPHQSFARRGRPPCFLRMREVICRQAP
ncbi:hypothetical protein SBBP1_640017 [Burkholderiales bacterium]|nr:hypothetical protein SBBP1_640017 [Burkholderiales bacterium]